MTSYVAPPSFYIYIEESFFVKALEKKEDRVRGLLGWCHFIFIDFSQRRISALLRSVYRSEPYPLYQADMYLFLYSSNLP